MKTTIKTHSSGNDLLLSIPEAIAQSLHLKSDDTLTCQIEGNKLILSPVTSSADYTLDELLSQEIETTEEIDWGKPEGEEVW